MDVAIREGCDLMLAMGCESQMTAKLSSFTEAVGRTDWQEIPYLIEQGEKAAYEPVPYLRRLLESPGIEPTFAGSGLRAMPRPKTLPATRDVLVDAADLVWVQAYPSAKQPMVAWTVFRPNGSVAARLTLPASLEVFEIGRDYLLGLVLNADTGVPEIHVYPIAR